jgi:hypothetical protein
MSSGVRHACDQGDGLDSYTWTQLDARLGGVQRIVDGPNNFRIFTEYIKVPGGKNGGSWAARIRGVPVNAGERLRMHDVHGKLEIYHVQMQMLASPSFSTPDWKASEGWRWKLTKTRMSVASPAMITRS